MKNIAIFASGEGTNAERITNYFKGNTEAEISLILSNKSTAGVLQRASKLGIKSVVFDRELFYGSAEISNLLEKNNIDLIVLAGFLWLVPENLLKTYKHRILNIHPALLPKYGGRGMYGNRVHESVLASNEKKSGITIHYVNDKYDEGQIIFQKEIDILPGETPESLASRIHKLEYEYYPKVIEEILFNR